MRKYRFNLLKLTGVLHALLLVSSLDGFAAGTNSWTNSISGLWSAATNWSAAQPPSTSFDFILITNAAAGGIKTVTVDSATPAANLSVRSLLVSAPAGSTNILLVTGVPSGTPLSTSKPLLVDRNGLLLVTNSTLSVGDTFDVLGGSVQMESGLIDTTPNFINIRVGRASGAIGTFTQNGGTVNTFGLSVAAVGSAQGIYTLNAGTVLSPFLTTLGDAVNSTGTVSIVSGQFIATNDLTKVGNFGSGILNQSGGTSAFSFLSIGDNFGGFGVVNISGGQLTVTPGALTDVTRIGNYGTAKFNISGGLVWLRGGFDIADNAPAIGDVLMTGGQLIATNDLVAIGRYGIGTFTITNAMAYFTNASVGRHTDATGTLTVQPNASVYCIDDLSIGRFTNAIGHVVVTGGLLSLTNDNIWVGREGIGDLTVSGGTVRARSLFVGMSEDGTNAPQGAVTITGGDTILSSNLVVGTSLVSTGQVSVFGGAVTVANPFSNGIINVASGTFTVDQGSVTADALLLTNSNGQFSFPRGTLTLRSLMAANGSPFVVGDGVNPATLQLQGGTYSFADGLVIASNASVTGCGTIVGTISNSGTLNTNCAAAAPVITSITKSGNTATISFATVSGGNHVLEFKQTLSDPTWTAILPGIIGDGSVTNKQDNTATNATRFYRIHLQ
ncbi:MAG: hypothetical protein HY298_00420 [Verrucomicrobia bacterium]|nr:hypothetical protein [Verrucomicrobiota bacterium]